jgi:hypothetical protein
MVKVPVEILPGLAAVPRDGRREKKKRKSKQAKIRKDTRKGRVYITFWFSIFWFSFLILIDYYRIRWVPIGFWFCLPLLVLIVFRQPAPFLGLIELFPSQ